MSLTTQPAVERALGRWPDADPQDVLDLLTERDADQGGWRAAA